MKGGIHDCLVCVCMWGGGGVLACVRVCVWGGGLVCVHVCVRACVCVCVVLAWQWPPCTNNNTSHRSCQLLYFILFYFYSILFHRPMAEANAKEGALASHGKRRKRLVLWRPCTPKK